MYSLICSIHAYIIVHMKRTTIFADEGLLDSLRAKEKVSLSAAIRRALEEYVSSFFRWHWGKRPTRRRGPRRRAPLGNLGRRRRARVKTVLIDTGPLYALADKNDSWHARVVSFVESVAPRLIVPITVLPEACYLIAKFLGSEAEIELADSVRQGCRRALFLLSLALGKAADETSRTAPKSSFGQPRTTKASAREDGSDRHGTFVRFG